MHLPSGVPAPISNSNEDLRARIGYRDASSEVILNRLHGLAGGMAHDVQNLIAAIISVAQLVEAEMEQDETVPMEMVIPRIRTLATNAAEILGALQRSLENLDDVMVEVSPNEIIDGMRELLRAFMPPNVSLKMELANAACRIVANILQMQRVVLNLVANSVQAIGNAEGIIQIATSLAGDGQVRLEISDTGNGLSEDALRKLSSGDCHPRGARHGLGLEIVGNLVRAHGGTIEVVSVPGRSCAFRVVLPCSSCVRERMST